MPTPQVQALLEKGRAAGYSDQEILNVIELNGIDVSTYRQPQKKGSALGNFARSVIKTPLRAATSAARLIGGATEAGLATVNRIKGNKAGEQYHVKRGMEILDQNRGMNLGPLGEDIKPIAFRNIGEGAARSFADVTGAGLELGSYAVGGGGAKSIISGIMQGGGKAAIRQLTFQGAKTGAASGALAGFGNEAQNEDSTLGSTLGAGFKGGILGGVLGAAFGNIGGRIALKKESERLLNEAVKKGTPEAVKFTQNASGQVVKDKVARLAIRSGIDERYVNLIKTASKEDKTLFQKMYKLSESASSDLNVTERPIEMVGNSFIGRIKYLFNQKQKVGQQLSDLVDNLPKTKAQINNVYDDFVSELGKANVGVTSKGLRFGSSALADDTGAQRLFNQIYSVIKPGKSGVVKMTPKQMNILRQRLFNSLDLATKGNAMSSNSERILKGVRKNLGNILENIDPAYGATNKQYARISDVLGRFNKIMGKDFQIESATANLKAGEVMRRVLGNASARPLQILVDADNLVKELGVKKATNIRTQINFADLMEDVFGLQQRNSLGGQVQRAGERMLDEGVGVAEDVAQGNAGKLLMRGAGKLLTKVVSPTPERQREAIKRLIGL